MHPEATDVLDTLDALRGPLEDALATAIGIESVNPAYPGVHAADHLGRESDAAEFFAELFRRAGATTELLTVEDGRGNAVGVVPGSGGGRSLAFNGHVDVVPVGDRGLWTHDPFGADSDGRQMFGRGTADQKAGLVGQAFAAIALRLAGVRLKGDLQLQAVSGEETGQHAIGINPVLDHLPLPDAAIVSEPSPGWNGRLAVGTVSAGLLRFTVHVEGLRAHGMMRGASTHPTNGGSAVAVNAIDKGFLVYSAIRQLELEWAETKRHPLFTNGFFCLFPGVARAQADDTPSTATIPNWMTIEYSVIHHPDESPDTVRREIETHVARAAQLDPWLRTRPPRIEWSPFAWAPLHVPTTADIVACLQDQFNTVAARGQAPADERLNASNCIGVSHASQFAERGVPAVLFGPSTGPGRTCLAHAPDEAVDLEQVHQAAKTYALAAMAWCGIDQDPPPASH